MDKSNKGNSFLKLKKLNAIGIIAFAGATVLLSGCSANRVTEKQNLKAPNVMLHSIDLQIDAAAQSAASSLDQLAAIEKNLHPAEVQMPFMDIDSPELRQYISTKWSGPIKPFIKGIAKTLGYHVQFYGKEPSLPILVNINTTGNVQTAKQILQNIDLQAKTSAAINIYPQQRLITMRYFNHAPAV